MEDRLLLFSCLRNWNLEYRKELKDFYLESIKEMEKYLKDNKPNMAYILFTATFHTIHIFDFISISQKEIMEEEYDKIEGLINEVSKSDELREIFIDSLKNTLKEAEEFCKKVVLLK